MAEITQEKNYKTSSGKVLLEESSQKPTCKILKMSKQ